MQSHLMSKRRSEVTVTSLRPLNLNRATEVMPTRGTLFLKVIKGTQLVRTVPTPSQQKERNQLQARLSALLAGDGRADSGGGVMHAVSVTSWLAEAEPESRTPTGGDGLMAKLGADGGSVGDASADASFSGSGESEAGGGARRSGRRPPRVDAARTSTKFVSQGDKEGGASWDEEFFFSRVAGEAAVRIVCIDKPLRDGAEDEIVGEALIPVSRLPQNEPVEQWYGLQPPAGSGVTFTKAALLLRFLFTTTSSPQGAAATAAAAANRTGTSPPPPVRRDGRGQAPASTRIGENGKAGNSGGAERGALESGGAGAGVGAQGVGRPPFGFGEGHRGAAVALGSRNHPALLLARGLGGVQGEGAGGGGDLAQFMRDGHLRNGSGGGGGAAAGRGAGDKFVVDPTLDPFGDGMDRDGTDALAGMRGSVGGLSRSQQLQMGKWGGTSSTLHSGTAAAEAALALSTDEVLPSGLVDYFLVVGPASDENGKLLVADYANCGFGSSRAPAVAASAAAGDTLPATAVEVESAVLEHFPEEQREDAPFPTKVEWFCFPQGLFLISSAAQPAPHVSSFVRFMSGVHSYGLCLTFYRQVAVSDVSDMVTVDETSSVSSSQPGDAIDGLFRGMGSSENGSFRVAAGSGRRLGEGSGEIVGQTGMRSRRRGRLWCPVCLCVLTHIPVLEGLMHWLRMFHWCLVRLEREAGGGSKRSREPSELDAAVFQITLEVPLPVGGVCAMSVKAFGERFATCPEPEFALPGVRELPALSFPLSLLLRSLRPQGVLHLFAAVLQEGRILLHSTKPALLAAVAEGIFALMYPLQWPYAYIPVLPSCLIEHVESPQPFILGVHTEWLGDIAPDALRELVVVDCDLGTVSGTRVEPLPSRVRRSLTQAVRAVLHGNLGNLDGAIRLSQPQRGQNGGVGEARRLSSGSSRLQRGDAHGSRSSNGYSIGYGGGFAAVGLAAWATDGERARQARAARAAGQGGGEKSSEAGDSDQRNGLTGDSDGGRAGGGGEASTGVRRKSRRVRESSLQARAEALLRLEFARAMADMLYGFTECLFFLHPERPIFNGARFLQEYCEESYVPFMSVVIDTQAFKYLLDTQDLPALRPFHDMLDKARREALKKGDKREDQVTGVHSSDETSPTSAFHGPFPTGVATDIFSESLGAVVGESLNENGGTYGEGGGVPRRHGAGARDVPPPAFAIPAPPLKSFVLLAGAEEEEVDFNASRGKSDVVPGRTGGGEAGDYDGEDGGGEGGMREEQEMEQAPEETREKSPPPSAQRHAVSVPLASTLVAEGVVVDDDGEGATGVSIAVGPVARAAAALRHGGGAGRGKDDVQRPEGRVLDARGTFYGKMKGATNRETAAIQSRSSPLTGAGKGGYDVEADEMADEAGGEKDTAAITRGRGRAGGRKRLSSRDPAVVCYDSAGEWESDASDGLPPVVAATTSRRQLSSPSSDPVAGATAGDTAERGYARRKLYPGGSLLSREAVVNGDVGGMGYGGGGRQDDDGVDEGQAGGVTQSATSSAGPAAQAAGESALEEAVADSPMGVAPEERTAPPTSTLDRQKEAGAGGHSGDGGGGEEDSSPAIGNMSAALSSCGSRRNVGGSIRERMKMFEKGTELRRGSDEGDGVRGGRGVGGGSRRRQDTEGQGVEKFGGSLRWPPSSQTPNKKPGGMFEGRELVLDAGPLRRTSSVGSQGGDVNRPPLQSLGGSKTRTVCIEPSSAPRPAPSLPPPAAPPAVTRPPAPAPAVSPAAGATSTASATSAADTAVADAAEAGAGAAVRAAAEREEVEEGNGTLEVEAAGLGTRGGPEPVYSASMLTMTKGMSSWKTEGSTSGVSSEGYYEPVVVPLSAVAWSHEPVLRLRDCQLPQAREWSLADIGREIEEDLGDALRAQTDGSSSSGLGHGSYSLKAGTGLAAAAGAGDGEELDRDSEKLLECLEAVYASDRVSEEVVVSVEETLRTKPVVQEMFLQVLRHACRRGYASSRGPTLLHGPSFETLARFSYTLLCVCVDRVDYSVAHTLLQLTGAYFQVHEGGGGLPNQPKGITTAGVLAESATGVSSGGGWEGTEAEAGYFSEFLSARISRHPIFTDMRFWQHVLKEAVHAKTEKLAKDKRSLTANKAPAPEEGKDGNDSVLSSPNSSEADLSKAGGLDVAPEAAQPVERKDPAIDSEIVCRQVKVFLYEMAFIGMRSTTAQRYVEAVSLQYNLQPGARNRLQETVRLVWDAAANVSGTASPPFGEPVELTAERWTEAPGNSSGNNIDPSIPYQNPLSVASSLTGPGPGPNSGGTIGTNTSGSTPTTARTTPNSGGGIDTAGGARQRSPSAFSATTGGAGGSHLPVLRLGTSELASQLEAESSPSPRPPTTPKSVGRYLSPGTTPHSKFHSGGTLSPASAAQFGGSTSYNSLSPRGRGRAASSESARTMQTAAMGTAVDLTPRRKAAIETADGGGEGEGTAPAGDGGSLSPRTGAAAGKLRHFFGSTGEVVRRTKPTVSTASSETSAVSPSPPPPPPPAPPGSRTPPSVLPGVQSAVQKSTSGETPSSRSNSVSVSGSGKSWGEGAVGKGELPSLLAPVDLHARDAEGVGHQGPILCLAANGSRACAGSTDCTVSVYDLSMVARVGVLTGHAGPVSGVACGDDWVVSASVDSTLRLWQSSSDGASTTPPRRGFISLGWQAPYATSAGTFKAKVMPGHTGAVVAMTAHPSRVEGQPWLALSGGEDHNIRLWDLRTRRCKVIFTGHSKAITCLTELKEDGSNLVLSGAKDCTVRLWDINEATGCKALRKFSGHEGSVGAILKIGPFAAVSCSNDRALRTWDHRVKGSVGVLRGHTGPVTCVQQMPANRSILASGSADGTVMMWDVRATAKGPIHTLRGHRDRVTGLLASGGSVYSCSEDGTMHEWDWGTGGIKSKFSGSAAGAVAVAGGRRPSSGSVARNTSGARQSGGISCIAATGQAVLTAGWDRTVRMWPRSSPTPRSAEAVAAAAAATASAMTRGGKGVAARGSGRRR